MKRRVPMVAATLFVLSILAAGCAGETSPPQVQPQPPKKEAVGAEKKTVSKPRVKLFTGTIVALDEEAGTLTLKGPKKNMGFQVHKNGKKQLEGLKIGDKVIVKHADEIALSIVKPRTNPLVTSPPPPAQG